MGNKAKILIDMDGVVCDFVAAMCEGHGRNDPRKPGLGEIDLEEAWGMSAKDFWKPAYSTNFWSSLDKFEWADALVEHCVSLVGLENVAFCSSPTKSTPHCIPGKIEWLDRHFPKVSRIFTKDKHFCADKNAILVDDTDSKVRKFVKHSGRAVKFPPPSDLSMDYLLGRITDLVHQINRGV